MSKVASISTRGLQKTDLT